MATILEIEKKSRYLCKVLSTLTKFCLNNMFLKLLVPVAGLVDAAF